MAVLLAATRAGTTAIFSALMDAGLVMQAAAAASFGNHGGDLLSSGRGGGGEAVAGVVMLAVFTAATRAGTTEIFL